MRRNLLLLLMLSVCFQVTLLAQTKTITGKVTDGGDGQPLPGVNILIKGTSRGSVTGIDGSFTLNAEASDVLVFSFIGYVTQEITIGNQTTIDVTLQPDIANLSEVVVVGYGTQEKSDVTGVVSTVDPESFNKGAIVSPDQLISGKIAGVQITPNTGAPGGQSSIRIRGGTSIGASNEPLYVIDGVPIDNSPHNPSDFSSGRNPLNFLNPNDIASFTVLKDASAAAIYGSRAANGVIIITTKKGGAGDAGRITYDGYFSVANSTGEPDMLSTGEFRQAVNERAPGNAALLGSANTDWYDEILQTATGQSHNISFSSGNDRMGFRASVGYQDLEGILKTSNTERLSLALSYNQRLLNDRLHINANIKGSQTNDQFAPGSPSNPGGVVGSAISLDPTQPIMDSEGRYWEWRRTNGELVTLAPGNPVAELALTQDFGESFRSIGNIQFDYDLKDVIPGLSANLNLGYDVSTGERKRFLPTTLRSQVIGNNGEVRMENFTRKSGLLEIYGNYKKEFKNINSKIDFTAGYSYQNFNNSFPGFLGQDLSYDFFSFDNPVVANEVQVFNSVIENRLISFFGRLNYDLMGKYLLTLSLRRDGSSRFNPSDQWGTFPSAAFAWRVMDEGFMQNAPSFLSDLKLRVGYGVNGNQEIGDYKYLLTYTAGDNRTRYQFGDSYVFTIRPNGYDENLKWEETTSYNIGIDFGLFENRLNGSIEYYEKKTKDLLSEITVPAGAHLTNVILTNLGELENKGVELQLNSTVMDKEDFGWDLGFNAAYNKNKILSLTNDEDPNFIGIARGGISGGVGNTVQIISVGEALDAFYVYKHILGSDGMPLPDRDVNGNLIDHNGDGETNDADLYEDINGDGMVNDQDRRIYKKPSPDVTLGLTSQMNYKNFDLSFTLRASLGNYVYNNVASNYGNYNRITGNNEFVTNPHASVLETNFVNPQYFSDYYVENASFLKMDNLTVGYTINNASNNMRFRVYGTVQNLFVITDYSGLDPEVGNASSSSATPRMGIDDNIYPRARTFILGVSIGL